VIDNNVAIGSNTRITNKDGVQEADRSDDGFVISEGIVVVLRNTIIPDGTVI
jgi:glucose-1-phosphate adenylyltransferase